MMPQMTEGVLIAIVGGIVTITQVLLNNSKKDKEEREGALNDNIQFLSNGIDNISKKISELKDTSIDNRVGIRHSLRYALFQDMKHAIERGYTYIDELNEVTTLYSVYTQLGGNGAISLLYERYKALEIKD